MKNKEEIILSAISEKIKGLRMSDKDGKDIMLAIKPQYCEKICGHIKHYEYRRKIPKNKVKRIYIYSTSPVSGVIGYAIVDDVVKAKLSDLWRKTNKEGGITKEDFDSYFEGCEEGYAFHFSMVLLYKKPQKLEKFGIKSVPQSFMYVDGDKFDSFNCVCKVLA